MEEPKEQYFSIGQVAEQFGVKVSRIRRLCENNLIPGVSRSHGQRWRIPPSAVIALKETGLPPVPHTVPEPDDDDPPAPEQGSPETSFQFTGDSSRVAGAKEALELAKIETEQLKCQLNSDQIRDLVKARDLLADRQRRQEEALRKIEEKAEDGRRWRDRWTVIALGLIPADAPPSARLQVKTRVTEELAKSDPAESEFVTKATIQAIVQESLSDWLVERKTAQEEATIAARTDKSITEASRSHLPRDAQGGFGRDSDWELRVQAETIQKIRESAVTLSMQEIGLIAMVAAKSVAGEFNHQKAAQAVLRALPAQLPVGYTVDELEAAQEAAAAAVEKQPVGTSERRMLDAIRAAIQPNIAQINARLAAAQKAKDAKVAAERRAKEAKNDAEMRESLAQRAESRMFIWLPAEKRTSVINAAKIAVAAIPPGTPEAVLKKIYDDAIDKAKRSQARLQKREALANATFRTHYWTLVRHVHEGLGLEFEDFTAEERAEILQELIGELTGDETDAEAKARLKAVIKGWLK